MRTFLRVTLLLTLIATTGILPAQGEKTGEIRSGRQGPSSLRRSSTNRPLPWPTSTSPGSRPIRCLPWRPIDSGGCRTRPNFNGRRPFCRACSRRSPRRAARTCTSSSGWPTSSSECGTRSLFSRSSRLPLMPMSMPCRRYFGRKGEVTERHRQRAVCRQPDDARSGSSRK